MPGRKAAPFREAFTWRGIYEAVRPTQGDAMSVVLETEALDLEGLRTRIAQLTADGFTAWLNPPMDGAGLIETFRSPRPVCVLILPPGTQALETLKKLRDVDRDVLGDAVEVIVLAARDPAQAPAHGFKALTLIDFDAPDVALALLGGGQSQGIAWDEDFQDLESQSQRQRRKSPSEPRAASDLFVHGDGTWRSTHARKPVRHRRAGRWIAAGMGLAVAVGALIVFWPSPRGLLVEPDRAPVDAETRPGEAVAGTAEAAQPVTPPAPIEAPAVLYAREALRLHAGPDTQTQVMAYVPVHGPIRALAPGDPAGWTRVETESGQVAFAFSPLLSDRQFLADGPDSVLRVQDCPRCPGLVLMRAARGHIGTRDDTEDLPQDEKPRILVELAHPRLAGETEVTRGQWAACVEANACQPRGASGNATGGEDEPMVGVSWHDANDYVQWLSALTGRRYRLPSEAEWEIAARAGTETNFYFGDRLSSAQANFDAKAVSQFSHPGRRAGRPLRVGTRPANSLGLKGMHGNVAEWVADCWQASHQGRPTDGTPVTTEGCPRRSIRGGSWASNARDARSASRHREMPNHQDVTLGFRVFRDL